MLGLASIQFQLGFWPLVSGTGGVTSAPFGSTPRGAPVSGRTSPSGIRISCAILGSSGVLSDNLLSGDMEFGSFGSLVSAEREGVSVTTAESSGFGKVFALNTTSESDEKDELGKESGLDGCSELDEDSELGKLYEFRVAGLLDRIDDI